MSSTTAKALFAAGLAIAAAVAYFVLRPPPPTPITAPAAPVAVAPPAPANEAAGVIEPTVRFPVPTLADEPAAVVPAVPLPELGASDTVLGEAIAELIGASGLSELVVVKDLVRRIVVTVDNLPGEQMPWARSPIRRAEGGFLARADASGMTIAPENSARYLPYVQLAETVSSARLVATYVRLYPLFQAAYEELGYPSAYFNDRLVAVIDHMLAAPEVEGPIRLLQPKVRYLFEDPELQRLSAGHKIMVRMGVDHARRIKARLRELRQQLTGVARQN